MRTRPLVRAVRPIMRVRARAARPCSSDARPCSSDAKPIEVVNLADAFATVSAHWSPVVAGAVNDAHVKLVKLSGEFVWHHHDDEDELFLVAKGVMEMQFRGYSRVVNPGEFVIVPRGVEHRPAALPRDSEVECVLIEPNSTLNTGTVTDEAELAAHEQGRGLTKTTLREL